MGEPAKVAACVDLLEKRRPPMLHEIDTLSARNARRICVVREDLMSARMLAVGDAERLMGFPAGWTEACVHAGGSSSETPEHDHDLGLGLDTADLDLDLDLGRTPLTQGGSALSENTEERGGRRSGGGGSDLIIPDAALAMEEDSAKEPVSSTATASKAVASPTTAVAMPGAGSCDLMEEDDRSCEPMDVDGLATHALALSDCEEHPRADSERQRRSRAGCHGQPRHRGQHAVNAAAAAAASTAGAQRGYAPKVRTPLETHEIAMRRLERSAEAGEAPAESGDEGEGEGDGEGASDGEESGEEDMGITPEEAADIVRIFVVASAVAVPQARWIGEQLNDPYGAKFQRQRLGIPFRREVLGGLDEPEGRAWPEAAWNVHPKGCSATAAPAAAVAGWEGRHALRDCSDTPVCLPFAPLGEFLHHEGPVPSAEASAAYITALQIAHADIPGFVMDTLDPYGEASAGDTAQLGGDNKPHCDDLLRLEDLADLASAEPSIIPAKGKGEQEDAQGRERESEQREGVGCSREDGDASGSKEDCSGSVGETFAEIPAAAAEDATPEAATPAPPSPNAPPRLEEEIYSGAEDEDNTDDPFMGGKPVWAPWKLGKGVEQVLWPGIALHRDRNKDILPGAALKIKVKGGTPETHQLVVFFGDRTYQWLPTTSLHEFRDGKYEERIGQNVKRNSAMFLRACEEARVWSRTWRRLRFQDEERKRKRRDQRRQREVAAAAPVPVPAAAAVTVSAFVLCPVSAPTPITSDGAVPTPDVKVEYKPNTTSSSAGKSGNESVGGLPPAGIRPFPLLLGATHIHADADEHSDGGRSGSLDSGTSVKASSGLFGIDGFGPRGYAGSLASSAEPEPCGGCRVCHARALNHSSRRNNLPFIPTVAAAGVRGVSKAAAVVASTAKAPAVHRHLKCPQVSAVRGARKGHAGALLALRRDGAVGQRVRVLWDVDDRFYPGRVCFFDGASFTHDVEYDDGELAVGLRLWNELVQVVEPQTDPRLGSQGRLGNAGRGPGGFHAGSVGGCAVGGKGAAGGVRRKRNKGDRDVGEGGGGGGKKRRTAENSGGGGDGAVGVAGAQRCDACARAHKGIAYCAARGHYFGGSSEDGGGTSEGGAGEGEGTRGDAHGAAAASAVAAATAHIKEQGGGSAGKADGAPRTAARRGGNGKFVVSESVGAALATAGVDIPERCLLCIRRKKGLAHCLKKGHVAPGPDATGVLLPVLPPKALKAPKVPKDPKASKVPKAPKTLPKGGAVAVAAENAVAVAAAAAAGGVGNGGAGGGSGFVLTTKNRSPGDGGMGPSSVSRPVAAHAMPPLPGAMHTDYRAFTMPIMPQPQRHSIGLDQERHKTSSVRAEAATPPV
jgi:hypothetical protein